MKSFMPPLFRSPAIAVLALFLFLATPAFAGGEIPLRVFIESRIGRVVLTKTFAGKQLTASLLGRESLKQGASEIQARISTLLAQPEMAPLADLVNARVQNMVANFRQHAPPKYRDQLEDLFLTSAMQDSRWALPVTSEAELFIPLRASLRREFNRDFFREIHETSETIMMTRNFTQTRKDFVQSD